MAGIGNINNAGGVGYTEMTGLGLNTQAQAVVKQDADIADAMSADILSALADFRKEGVLNPTTEQMEARLSVTSSGGLSKHQLLNRELGNQGLHGSYSLKEWGDIADKLAINAAKKRSQLPIGNGGGIQQVNGQYFVNGQEMSLSQVNFCVRANQYQLIDQQIADQLDAIQRNNARAKQAQAVLAAFKTYDGEKIGVDQSATTDLATMMNSGGGSWGVVQHYLNTNFGVTENSNPSYQDYANMMASGSYSTDVTTISDIKRQLTNVNFASTSGLSGATLAQVKSANGSIVLNQIAGYLGLTTPATYDQVKTKLGSLANSFTPPPNASDWTADTIIQLKTAIDTRIGQLGANLDSSKTASMRGNLDDFFSLLKAADPTFYSTHISDTNGGPPFKITGSITNVEFGSLKTNFGTFLQSNSTDNQVAQQRLEALNNTRQAVLAGMSAFTQGQAQVTDRIGGNL